MRFPSFLPQFGQANHAGHLIRGARTDLYRLVSVFRAYQRMVNGKSSVVFVEPISSSVPDKWFFISSRLYLYGVLMLLEKRKSLFRQRDDMNRGSPSGDTRCSNVASDTWKLWDISLFPMTPISMQCAQSCRSRCIRKAMSCVLNSFRSKICRVSTASLESAALSDATYKGASERTRIPCISKTKTRLLTLTRTGVFQKKSCQTRSAHRP